MLLESTIMQKRQAGVMRFVLAATVAVLLPALVGAQQPADPEVAARAEAVVDDLVAGRFAEVYARFDQKMREGLPVEKIAAGWNTVQQAAGSFERRLSTTTDAKGGYRIAIVSCAFERANVDVQVVFDGQDRIAGLFMRPTGPRAMAALPDYAKPGAYTERDVTVDAGGWPLPGTLTLPAGSGPFPAIVVVHGSGPLDRDGTIGPNKPYRDLAVGLASRGIAVLRYDKRTLVHGQKMLSETDGTVDDEVIDDARAAVALLRTLPEIDDDRVFVLGHSFGGMLAPRIAQSVPDLAGLIVMAGATRSIEQALVEQTRYLLMADGLLTDDEKAQLMEVEQLAGQIRALDDDDRRSTELIAGAPAAYWLDLRGYDPTVLAAKSSLPMLILQGERDYQVTMRDFDRWRRAVDSRANVTLRSYPKLNHLFMAGEGQSLPSEYTVPGNIDAQVIDDIARWIESLQ
jgi:dienelactone hydrolase